MQQILARAQKSHSFALIVDGTQDMNGVEQESVCIRFVNDDLQPCEEILGFYSVEGTTGQMLASCVKDVLLRYQLPLDKLRGQTYDGASNMSGAYNGCQAIIKKDTASGDICPLLSSLQQSFSKCSLLSIHNGVQFCATS